MIINDVKSCYFQIEPLTGPKMGGTKLTIVGKNLGKSKEDIEGGISVAEVACNPIIEEYKPPYQLVSFLFDCLIFYVCNDY
jgi:plexin A